MSDGSDSIVIVGTGFAGLGMAIRLKQAGIDDFTLLERAGSVGGTWRENHYPGAACDIESHLYSFSFAPNPSWTRTFAPQAEILGYLEHCVEKYGIRPHIRFYSPVLAAAFDETTGLWEVHTSDGKAIRARVLIAGCGGLSRPSVPDLPGLASFMGKTFHTARWDHGFALDGKTIAVIGTGASAIQVVPEIAPRVGKMHLFQRTAAWVIPKRDREITERRRRRFRRIPLLQRLARLGQFFRHELLAYGFVVEPRVMKLGERWALRYLEESVADDVLRAKLTPRFTLGCKRVLLSNDYFSAVQRENVELVTDGIAAIRAHSVVTCDGRERPVDAIVCATGFEAAEAAAPFSVSGREGRDLDATWRGGAEAYLGTTVSGFPNLFLLVGPNTGLGHSSMILMIESQIAYVLDCVRTMRARRLKLVDVRPEAQARFNERLHARFPRTVWATGCRSWYQTASGKNTTLWPGFTLEFWLRLRRFDAAQYQLVAKAP